MERSTEAELSYAAVYLFLRGVTSLGTRFAFVSSVHAHTLNYEQAHAHLHIYLNMHIHRGTVALKLHPRRERITF